MAVFDADKDISPGIVVSVPFFGGILALMMIGGTRVKLSFFVYSRKISAENAERMTIEFLSFSFGPLCAFKRSFSRRARNQNARAPLGDRFIAFGVVFETV
jgi:hypothetical protein